MAEFSKEEIKAAAEWCLNDKAGTCEGCLFPGNYDNGFVCRDVFAKAFLEQIAFTPSLSELSAKLDRDSTKFKEKLEEINTELNKIKENK